MSINKKLIISSSVFLITFFSIFFSRTLPQTQLWKGYKVLYVNSSSLSEENIYSILLKNGCDKTISRLNQKIPIYSPLAPVQVQKKDSYIYKRNAFFTDKSNSFKVFYVNDRQIEGLKKSVDEINSYSNSYASTDGGVSFPWICPIIALMFFSFLLYKSKYSIEFLLVSISLVFLSFTRPFYSVCSASILVMLFNFFAGKLYGRSNLAKDLKNAFILFPFLAVPFLFLFFSSFINSFLLFCAFTCGWSALILRNSLIDFYNVYKNYSLFSFSYIKKSAALKLINKNNFKVLLISIVFIVVFFIVYVLTSNFSYSQISGDAPELPGPVTNTDDSILPSVNDFMDWSWITISFPFRKMNDNYEYENLTGQTVEVPEFTIEDNKILAHNTKVLTYDSSFCSSIYDKIDKLDYPAVEKMMIKQGKNSNFNYTKNTGSSSERGVIISLIFFALVPAFLYLYFITGNKKKWL